MAEASDFEVEAGRGGKPCVIELSHAMGYDVESRDKRLLQTGIQFVRPGRRWMSGSDKVEPHHTNRTQPKVTSRSPSPPQTW